MWHDDEPDGFPHVIEDFVFAVLALVIVVAIAFIIKLGFYWV